ncbi:TPA: Mor transcription activator family protein, partial [Salmonella enterica subsp. enterica serovar 6,7:y:-]
KIASEVVDTLRQSMGGCQLYFPKLNQKDNSERNAEIFKEYKRGAFVNELAIKYNVSLQAIYNAIRKERERQQAEEDISGS